MFDQVSGRPASNCCKRRRISRPSLPRQPMLDPSRRSCNSSETSPANITAQSTDSARRLRRRGRSDSGERLEYEGQRLGPDLFTDQGQFIEGLADGQDADGAVAITQQQAGHQQFEFTALIR